MAQRAKQHEILRAVESAENAVDQVSSFEPPARVSPVIDWRWLSAGEAVRVVVDDERPHLAPVSDDLAQRGHTATRPGGQRIHAAPVRRAAARALRTRLDANAIRSMCALRRHSARRAYSASVKPGS